MRLIIPMKPMIADTLKNCVGVLQTHPDLISLVKIFKEINSPKDENTSPISAFDFWVRNGRIWTKQFACDFNI